MDLQNCDEQLQSDQFGKMRAKKCLMFDAPPHKSMKEKSSQHISVAYILKK